MPSGSLTAAFQVSLPRIRVPVGTGVLVRAEASEGRRGHLLPWEEPRTALLLASAWTRHFLVQPPLPALSRGQLISLGHFLSLICWLSGALGSTQGTPKHWLGGGGRPTE